MNIQDAQHLAISLMTKHGLQNWDRPETVWGFIFDRAKTRAGCCHYRRHQISLSKHYVALNTEADVRNTILHEIAIRTLEGSILGRCTPSCEARHIMHRFPRCNYACTRCRAIITWRRKR